MCRIRLGSSATRQYLMTVLLLSLFNPTIVTGTSSGQTSQQLLSQANYYYNSNDTSDRAADIYRSVLTRFPKSREAEQASFYIALYYHKKFYVLRATRKVDDWSSLNKAEEALRAYWTSSKTMRWTSYLSDAHYLLALIAMQRGYPDVAVRSLESIARSSATSDAKLYVDSLVWSANAADAVGKTCDAKSLAAETSRWANEMRSRKDVYFEIAISNLRGWAKNYCSSK